MPNFIQHLIVPTDAELRHESNYQANWQTYRSRIVDCPDSGLSRRPQAESMSVAMAFIDHSSIRTSDGRPYRLPDFDTVFPDYPDYRTFSEYTAIRKDIFLYRRKTRCEERLRFFWIFMNIYEDLNKHINLNFIHKLLKNGSIGHVEFRL